MNKNITILLISLAVLLITGCGTQQRVTYINEINADTIINVAMQQTVKIQPLDHLDISVQFPVDDQVSSIFNKNVMNNLDATRNTRNVLIEKYIVDHDGNVQMPVIGNLHVAGLTTREVEELVYTNLQQYITERNKPVVTCRIENFSVTILGDVTRPGVYYSANEHLTLFQALAMAKDMTIWGKRDKVRIIREAPDGTKSTALLNLNDKDIMMSPYFYLKQNDVLYVEPNKAKKANRNVGTTTTYAISFASVLVSIGTLMYQILK